MRRSVFIAILGVLTACDDTGLGGRPTLSIDASLTEMEQGGTAVLRPSFDGEPINPARVDWTSRDQSTVLVAADGVARGVNAGAAWVVAQYGDAMDSVRLSVRFPGLPAGTVAARVGDDRSLRLGGRAYLWRSNPGDDESVMLRATNLGGISPDRPLIAADSVVDISFPGPLAVGGRAIPAPEVTIDGSGIRTTGTGGHVMMRARDPRGGMRFYFPVGEGSQVEIREVTPPTGLGYADGRVVGAVSFEAAALLAAPPETCAPLPSPCPLSERTIPVYVQFELPLESTPLPTGSIQINTAGEIQASVIGGSAVLVGDGVRFSLDGTFAAGSGQRFTDVQGWLPRPAVGRPTLVRREFPSSFDAAGGPDAWVLLEERLSTALAGELHVFEEGTLTITDYRAPTATRYGVLVGELAATFAASEGAPRQVHALFELPILPAGRRHP
jgi:hypothetical protein